MKGIVWPLSPQDVTTSHQVCRVLSANFLLITIVETSSNSGAREAWKIKKREELLFMEGKTTVCGVRLSFQGIFAFERYLLADWGRRKEGNRGGKKNCRAIRNRDRQLPTTSIERRGSPIR